MLLIVLVRQHTTKNVNVSIVGLGGCSAHRQSGGQLLLNELTLAEVQQVQVRSIWCQEVERVLICTAVLALDAVSIWLAQ